MCCVVCRMAEAAESFVGSFACLAWSFEEALSHLGQSSGHIAKLAYSAVEVIESAIQQYGIESLALSFNAGKDCMVLLHLIHLALLKNHYLESATFEKDNDETVSSQYPIYVVYFKTSNDTFQQVSQFMDIVEKRYGFHTQVEEGEMKTALQNSLARRPFSGIFMGTRRTDPYCGHLQLFSKTDSNWPQVMRVNPIIDWDYADIWAFTRALNLPYCVLYEMGYTSLGGPSNTVPNPCLQLEDGSFQPAYLLVDGSKERDGRLKSKPSKPSNM